MTAFTLLFKILRASRDLRAVRRGRVPQRVWNRGVSRLLRGVGRRLYK